MSKYRARVCPKCNYFMGFSVVKSLFKSAETCVTGFCLNCNYKFPVHAVIRGMRRATSPIRRGALRLAKIAARPFPGTPPPAQGAEQRREPAVSPADYPRHLRAIGQDIENLSLSSFNLQCADNHYSVWARADGSTLETTLLSHLSKNRLHNLWKHKSQPASYSRCEYFLPGDHTPTRRFRYSLRELDRIERAGRSRRREHSGSIDGHSPSQLLRTIGTLVAQRGERLLAISWQELSVSIVVQTNQGRCDLDVFRHDSLYDHWVRMYLRRDGRALSDVPR